MNDRDRLSVLRQESAIRNIYYLQLVGVVIELQRNGVHVLSARHHHIHSKSCAFGLGQRRRIKQE